MFFISFRHAHAHRHARVSRVFPHTLPSSTRRVHLKLSSALGSAGIRDEKFSKGVQTVTDSHELHFDIVDYHSMPLNFA